MITKALEKEQQFTFSSTDNDFIGNICEDKIGIEFSSKAARKLSLAGSENIPVSFEMLTNNHIRAKVNETDSMNIVYADKHLIVGNIIPNTHVVVNVDGDFVTRVFETVEIQDTKDGEFTGLLTYKNKFAFAYGKSPKEVIDKCKKGIKINTHR